MNAGMMADKETNSKAAVAFRCPDVYNDFVIAIFEGKTIGDAVGKFAAWKLDEASMNLDGSWRGCERMQKAVREWHFPPVPEGFDFSSVKVAQIRDYDYYDTPSNWSAGNRDHYYALPYNEQFADFVGRLKWLSENDSAIMGLIGHSIAAPYPNLGDATQGFDPIFAYTPYLHDYEGASAGNDAYCIIGVASDEKAVEELKQRYSGIDRRNVTKELKDAYMQSQYSIIEQWGEDEDLKCTRVEVRGTVFGRDLVFKSTSENWWGWVMVLKTWPKNTLQDKWQIDEDAEDILDRIVIGARPPEFQKDYAKWWLKDKHRKDMSQVGGDFNLDDWMDNFIFWYKKIDPKSQKWLKTWMPKGSEAPPSGGRDVAVRIPNLLSSNPSFAAMLIKYIRDKFDNDAPSVYRKAHVSRKTYSSIVGNELRPVSKQTAIMFALALQLPPEEAYKLLAAAGYSLSEFILEDIIVRYCFASEIYDLERVNEILLAHHAKPLLEQ